MIKMIKRVCNFFIYHMYAGLHEAFQKIFYYSGEANKYLKKKRMAYKKKLNKKIN